MSDIKVFATVVALEEDEVNGSQYRVAYSMSEPTGVPPHTGGFVFVPFDANKTETETNADIQQAVAVKADAETGGIEALTINDVRGGRI